MEINEKKYAGKLGRARLEDFHGRIQQDHLPLGGEIACDVGMPRDTQALVTSILVVPDRPGVVTPDLGVLEFWYNARVHFAAPINGLMNRYHGFTTLAQVASRLRIVLDPSQGLNDWLNEQTFMGAIPEPIHMVEGLMYSVRHIPPLGIGAKVFGAGFLVEVQALYKDSSVTHSRMFEWKASP